MFKLALGNHKTRIHRITMSKDGNYLVSAAGKGIFKKGSIKIWKNQNLTKF